MNSYEDPALSYECDREAELESLRARLARVEAERDAAVILRRGISNLLKEREARLAEATDLIDEAYSHGDTASWGERAAKFLRATDSAEPREDAAHG